MPPTERRRNGDYYENQGIKWYKMTCDAAARGVELWAVQYCSVCKLISPVKLVECVKEKLSMGNDMYRQ